MRKVRPLYRIVAWGKTASGTELVACDDVGRYQKLTDAVEWAEAVIADGNAVWAQIVRIDEHGEKVVRVLPRETRH